MSTSHFDRLPVQIRSSLPTAAKCSHLVATLHQNVATLTAAQPREGTNGPKCSHLVTTSICPKNQANPNTDKALLYVVCYYLDLRVSKKKRGKTPHDSTKRLHVAHLQSLETRW